jgi:hypothetical protein
VTRHESERGSAVHEIQYFRSVAWYVRKENTVG